MTNTSSPWREVLKNFYETRGSEIFFDLLVLFYARAANDLMIGFFFDGQDLHKIAKKQSEFLLKAIGISPSYSGKSPAHAHLHLAPILPGHFDRRTQILKSVLNDQRIEPKVVDAWLEFEALFRNAVVQQIE
jgi:truncated hemoglobin YjbI